MKLGLVALIALCVFLQSMTTVVVVVDAAATGNRKLAMNMMNMMNMMDMRTNRNNKKRKDGANCNKDNQCRSNACAIYKYEPSSNKRCCSKNQKVSDPTGKKYCSNKKAGNPCFTDKMCKTGKCNKANSNNGRCSCDQNKDCNSNVCVQGDCKKNKQNKNDICDNNSDCKNKVCAHKEYEPKADLICCPTGRQFSDVNNFKVCGGQADNKRCFGQIVCRGDRCQNGRCRP